MKQPGGTQDGTRPTTRPDLATLRAQHKQNMAELELRRKGLDGMREKLEAQFESQVDAMLDERTRDEILTAQTVADAWKLLRPVYAQEVEAPLKAEEEAVRTMEEELAVDESNLNLIETEEAFLQANPDVDLDALNEFVLNELSKSQQDALLQEAGGDTAKAYELAYQKMTGAAPGQPKEPDLPADLDGIAGTSGDVDGDGDGEGEADDDFLAQVGLA